MSIDPISVTKFIQAPDEYVLRIQREGARKESIIAERKGIFTWIKAHFFLTSASYNLQKIVDLWKRHTMSLLGFEEVLSRKIEKYNQMPEHKGCEIEKIKACGKAHILKADLVTELNNEAPLQLPALVRECIRDPRNAEQLYEALVWYNSIVSPAKEELIYAFIEKWDEEKLKSACVSINSVFLPHVKDPDKLLLLFNDADSFDFFSDFTIEQQQCIIEKRGISHLEAAFKQFHPIRNVKIWEKMNSAVVNREDKEKLLACIGSRTGAYSTDIQDDATAIALILKHVPYSQLTMALIKDCLFTLQANSKLEKIAKIGAELIAGVLGGPVLQNPVLSELCEKLAGVNKLIGEANRYNFSAHKDSFEQIKSALQCTLNSSDLHTLSQNTLLALMRACYYFDASATSALAISDTKLDELRQCAQRDDEIWVVVLSQLGQDPNANESKIKCFVGLHQRTAALEGIKNAREKLGGRHEALIRMALVAMLWAYPEASSLCREFPSWQHLKGRGDGQDIDLLAHELIKHAQGHKLYLALMIQGSSVTHPIWDKVSGNKLAELFETTPVDELVTLYTENYHCVAIENRIASLVRKKGLLGTILSKLDLTMWCFLWDQISQEEKKEYLVHASQDGVFTLFYAAMTKLEESEEPDEWKRLEELFKEVPNELLPKSLQAIVEKADERITSSWAPSSHAQNFKNLILLLSTLGESLPTEKKGYLLTHSPFTKEQILTNLKGKHGAISAASYLCSENFEEEVLKAVINAFSSNNLYFLFEAADSSIRRKAVECLKETLLLRPMGVFTAARQLKEFLTADEVDYFAAKGAFIKDSFKSNRSLS